MFGDKPLDACGSFLGVVFALYPRPHPDTSMHTLFWELGIPVAEREVVVSRSFWNHPDPFIGRELCISMSGKIGRRGFAKRENQVLLVIPLHSPCVHRCFLPGPPPFTGGWGSPYWPQRDGKWLMVEQKAGLPRGWPAQGSVEVSLGADLGGALALAV